MKLMVPLSVRSPAGVTGSVTAPVTSVAATTGSSLVPVMVTSICRLISRAAVVVDDVMVKLSTLVWSVGQILDSRSATV